MRNLAFLESKRLGAFDSQTLSLDRAQRHGFYMPSNEFERESDSFPAALKKGANSSHSQGGMRGASHPRMRGPARAPISAVRDNRDAGRRIRACEGPPARRDIKRPSDFEYEKGAGAPHRRPNISEGGPLAIFHGRRYVYA